MSEPGDVLSGVTVERFVAGGEGLARHDDGRVVFVKGGVPGDRVTASVTAARRDWLRADVVAVEVPSRDRITASCASRRNGCGGCDWAEVDDERQLEFKAGIVAEALRRTARLEFVPAIGRSVARTGYRTSIRVVGDEHGRVAFRQAASSATADARDCEVTEPGLRAVLASLRITPGLEVSLRQSVATGELSARWDSRLGSVEGLASHAVMGASARITERVVDVDLVVSAGSFFQSGPQAAQILVESVSAVAPEVMRATHVLDAYGGIGLFAATVGRAADMVTLVESSRSAIADAHINLDSRGPAARVVRSDVAEWRPDPMLAPVDVVIADPARTGLGRPGVRALMRCHPAVVVLVSCDPVAMARDASLLAAAGYQLERAEVHDLFPGTHHVEVVSRFVPAGTLA
jgi:23S rRNA (uracil1939-C5)-methyltransferase